MTAVLPATIAVPLLQEARAPSWVPVAGWREAETGQSLVMGLTNKEDFP